MASVLSLGSPGSLGSLEDHFFGKFLLAIPTAAPPSEAFFENDRHKYLRDHTFLLRSPHRFT
ncbi:Protein of unknown function [Pyronema omphalodes CBS 100304]|uniref:Uncharacterized protein n=1 Tax=Pyronema omphalodes (strain CBS 100304) TaxID=1076935 RepID=U4LC19_PYROM|nr:Protein of unknown function [Pyronema omphalodes CBS 100304]